MEGENTFGQSKYEGIRGVRPLSMAELTELVDGFRKQPIGVIEREWMRGMSLGIFSGGQLNVWPDFNMPDKFRVLDFSEYDAQFETGKAFSEIMEDANVICREFNYPSILLDGSA